jgi:PadR family transcriptional regulator PadR
LRAEILMVTRQFLGEFETIVLLAILKIGRDAYGVSIFEAIEEVTGRRVSTGALYTTLQRLEDKGFISSRMGEATPERGGRAKKYFEVSKAGREALAKSSNARMSFAKHVDLGYT